VWPFGGVVETGRMWRGCQGTKHVREREKMKYGTGEKARARSANSKKKKVMNKNKTLKSASRNMYGEAKGVAAAEEGHERSTSKKRGKGSQKKKQPERIRIYWKKRRKGFLCQPKHNRETQRNETT